MKIDWSRKSHDFTENEISQLAEFIRKAPSFTQDVQRDSFEEEFAAYTANPNCIAVSTGTAALELSAALCDFEQGDEVICPAHTWCSSVIPFTRYGASVKWADIDRDTRLITVETIERLITPKTRAILVVHLYGLMCDMKPIMELAKQHDLLVIEDCAQSMGATLDGIHCGNFGDFSCYSFHTQKNMTTLGEGGMLSVKDPVRAKRARGMMHNGLEMFSDQQHYWQPAMSNVVLDEVGHIPFNFCLSEIQCLAGRLLLKRIDRLNEDRKARAIAFKNELSDIEELTFQHHDHTRFGHVYHLLPAQFKSPLDDVNRNDLIRLLYEKYEIKCIVQYYPLYRYDLFRSLGFAGSDCPNTDEYFDNMISFPFYQWMSDADFSYEIGSIREAINAVI